VTAQSSFRRNDGGAAKASDVTFLTEGADAGREALVTGEEGVRFGPELAADASMATSRQRSGHSNPSLVVRTNSSRFAEETRSMVTFGGESAEPERDCRRGSLAGTRAARSRRLGAQSPPPR